jgi:hypothetical protein
MVFKSIAAALDQSEWYAIGVDRGWCSHVYCVTHEGLPVSKEEEGEFEEGNDLCIHGVRIYELDGP